LSPYWFEEAGKTVTVNAARYRDVIKNFSADSNLSENLSEGQLRMTGVLARWGSTSYCPWHYCLFERAFHYRLLAFDTDHESATHSPDLNP